MKTTSCILIPVSTRPASWLRNVTKNHEREKKGTNAYSLEDQQGQSPQMTRDTHTHTWGREPRVVVGFAGEMTYHQVWSAPEPCLRYSSKRCGTLPCSVLDGAGGITYTCSVCDECRVLLRTTRDLTDVCVSLICQKLLEILEYGSFRTV